MNEDARGLDHLMEQNETELDFLSVDRELKITLEHEKENAKPLQTKRK